MNAQPHTAFALRLAVALGVWFATAIGHRKVSDAVGEQFATPWGVFVPIEYTTEAMVVVVLALVAALSRRAHLGRARCGTLTLWALLLAAAVVCHHTLVTIDIEVIHYPQYALIAVLLAWALDPHGRRCVLVDVLLVSAALSVADEALQYFHLMHKARYFDFNDLVLNQLGTLAGLLWRYGFPVGDRPAPRAPTRLRTVLLVGSGVCAALCGILVLTGALVVVPQTPLTQDTIVRLHGGLRIVLQWEPGIYDNMRPSRSGGTYYVIGPWPWLAILLGATLIAWVLESRLRIGDGTRMSIIRRRIVNCD